MKIIGLTGGIASGKSTVSGILREWGAVILDADQIAREIVEPGQPAWQEIRSRFGEGVFNPDGTIDRRALGAIVFADPVALQDLNRLTHARVLAVTKERLAILKKMKQPPPLVVIDAALLIESKLTISCEEVWVLQVDEATQLARLMARDGMSREDARQRIKSQMPLAEKLQYADRVINTGVPLEILWSNLATIWSEVAKN